MNNYLMCDGRQFTDYRCNGYVNSLLKMKYDKDNSHSYKQFLVKNADEIRNEMKDYYYDNGLCSECKNPIVITNETIKNTHFSLTSLCDKPNDGNKLSGYKYGKNKLY